MARGKKNEKEITIEERLEQALVPAEEQPCSVPENWCWVRLSAISKTISKGTTPSGGKSVYTDNGVSFIRVENINDDGTISHEGIAHISEDTHFHLLKRSILEKGDILISIAGTLAKTGIVRYIDLPLNTNQAIAFVRLLDIGISREYIKCSIDNPITKSELLKKTKVTSIPNLTLEIIGDCPIPLPPLAEQQRIVDRIENLFTKLDEAKEKAQAVVDGFEARKTAILHKAFTGELTEKWRKKTGLGITTWRKKPLKDICKYMRAGGDKPQDFSNNKDKTHQIPVVANGISDDGIIGFTGIPKEEGDSVTVSGRGTIGFSVYRDYPYYPVVRLIILAPQNYIRGLYLKYYFDAFPEKGTGSSIPQLTVPMIKEKQVLFPTLDEQDVILDTIDILIKKEQQAKETAEAVLDQIEAMKKSILARAFRGELGTNDPGEESAEELLKQTLKETDI